ncbi:MAG: SRPBCC domain-containing protein [Rubrobacteraceae bacterium]|nr:SRPBCC domain-containing protein [Rubrobacteraceae bacterium]
MSHELRFERVFDAAPEEVFDALTHPDGLEEMYGLDEPGWIVQSGGEVRVGGLWRVAFGPSREELYRFVHKFGVIDRPRRIAYASKQTAPDGSSFETDVEITLEERDGKTLMTLVEKGFPSAGVRDLHEVGTPHAFDRVERFVRVRFSGERSGP